jgi:hypothetical protein
MPFELLAEEGQDLNQFLGRPALDSAHAEHMEEATGVLHLRPQEGRGGWYQVQARGGERSQVGHDMAAPLG